MAREGRHRLPAKIASLATDDDEYPRGRLFADGGGLYLRKNEGGSLSWQYRYSWHGTVKTIGIGELADISLKQAREQAEEWNVSRRQQRDPHDERRQAREAAKALEAARRHHRAIERASRAKLPEETRSRAQPRPTLPPAIPGSFREFAESYIAGRKDWEVNTRGAWERSMTLAYKALGDLPLIEIKKGAHIKPLVEPVWASQPPTGDKLARHLAIVFDAAIDLEVYHGANPARGMSRLLGAPGNIKAVEHRPAMGHGDVPAFMAQLSEHEDEIGALALQFLILTVARTKEVRFARWTEIADDEGYWEIAKIRGKGPKSKRKAHRVPLSPPARAIIEKLRARPRVGDYIFPGDRHGQPLSTNVFLARLYRDGLKGKVTAHGFRSSFRDWGADLPEAEFPRWLLEMSLAHTVADDAEKAYWRSDVLAKRARLMDLWSRHCTGPASRKGGKLVQFKRG